MDDRLQLSSAPLAHPDNVILGAHYRITVLTERLLRLEWSESGTFEDRATQVVLNRDFPPVPFTLRRDGDAVQLVTRGLQLDYDGGPFRTGGLSVRRPGDEGWSGVWHYGERHREEWRWPGNLGGTARTLDTADGAVPLEPGVVSATGTAVLDDSASLALDHAGMPVPRVGELDLYVFAHGHDAPAAVRDFYALTGPQPMLPRYALGNWWSRYYAYRQSEYLDLMDRFAEEGLPFSVAVLDMDWHHVDIDPSLGSGWTGFSWNRELFPDPEAMLAQLHERGLAVTLNLHPADGVRAHEDAYPAVAERMGIDPATRAPIPTDVTDPRFMEAYFTDVLHPLEEMGVDFWWVDWQQGSASRLAGLDPLWLLNHLHYLDNGRRGRRPITFSRYAGPGSHRYPIGFSGDAVVSWDTLAFQPYFTATAANIGYGWWSHDIGGHIWGYRDEELATRWVQLGVFSPINRLHSTVSQFARKEPWTYGPVEASVMGEALRLRHRLIPYLYTMNAIAHSAGQPLVRPLYWLDPRPETVLGRPTAFAFGSELIVAPITAPRDRHSKHAVTTAWLPEGEWVDWFTGVRYEGGREVRLHRRLDQYPVLARAGAIVPLTGPAEFKVGNPESIELRITTGADGEFLMYEDDDALEPRACHTRFRWSDADGELTIEPATGDLDVVPAVRRYTVTWQGLAVNEAVGFVDGWDAATASLTVDLGEVATADGATVRLSSLPESADNRVDERVLDFLMHADIEFMLKERLWGIFAMRQSFAARMQALDAVDLPAELRGPISELLLASP